jgi:hypothetical protein
MQNHKDDSSDVRSRSCVSKHCDPSGNLRYKPDSAVAPKSARTSSDSSVESAGSVYMRFTPSALKSNVSRPDGPMSCTRPSGKTSLISTRNEASHQAERAITCTVDGFNFQPFKMSIISATVNEIMFLLTIREFGFEVAAYLASKFDWQCQRLVQTFRGLQTPLRAVYATPNAAPTCCEDSSDL